jgi:hypothetical protein
VIKASNSHHERVQTTTFGSEEVVEETFSEPTLEDPSREHFDQIECNLDLDKFLKQAVMFKELSLEDPLEESFAQFEFDLDLDMVHEQAKALLDPAPEMRMENGDKEMEEQIEPPPISNWSNDKEVSTKTHSFITIPLKTQHDPQASSFQCFKEPSYVEIFKVSRTERCKYRNRHTKKIF